MEVIDVSQRIESLCKKLAVQEKQLQEFVRSAELPKALKDYRRAMQIEVVGLRDEGKPATLIDTLAKGKCADQEAELEWQKQKYKAILAGIECTKTELTGYQSVFRHLSHT